MGEYYSTILQVVLIYRLFFSLLKALRPAPTYTGTHIVAILSVHLSVTRGVVVPERDKVLFRQIFLNRNGSPAILFIIYSRNANRPSAAFRHIRSGRGLVYYDLPRMSVSLRKIIEIVATSCQILRLKYTKFDFRWSSAPNPTGGS